MKPIALTLAVAICIVAAPSIAHVAELATAPSLPIVPDGFSIELVAGPPLVERPIVAAFDYEGRLYVAESSGSNDPVEQQLAERPHRVVRLEDVDGDGRFDKRVVFADRMMFLAGAMFQGGSLYVSAPPSIWKLTDHDGDGVAEDRVEWFQGKTLTGCANDLHGPYAGPDGWIYWCKGAFAEQMHMVNGREWKSSAAHIFRCRPDGTGLEPVMTGGMDNPVDVVFTPEGERIYSATYLEGDGRRDGLAHAIYGGVYGKVHDVLDGHPRTGELMPTMALMSPTAPCGLERYEADAFGPEYRDNLFACQFNLRKVSRHALTPQGSTFASADSDFVTSDAVDFHPTDVLADDDGSLLVIDTGGWYKLCCPTSQLWKPDVLGGIYRVRRNDAPVVDDPRGRMIDWPNLTVKQLWTQLADPRPAVRLRLSEEFASRRDTPEMQQFLTDLEGTLLVEVGDAALARTWGLTRLETAPAKRITRRLLEHADPRVRQAALHAVSLHRDAEAFPQLLKLLASDSPAIRRVAAEALGRIGDDAAVPHLLAAAAKAEDRILQHSITYALIEFADPSATQAGLASDQPETIASALIALDQMPGGTVTAEQVIPLLTSQENRLRDDAQWLVRRHPEWGGKLAGWFREQLASLPEPTQGPLESMLIAFAGDAEIQRVLADAATSTDSSAAARQLALRVMAQAKLGNLPTAWSDALASTIAAGDRHLIPLAVAVARALPPAELPSAALNQALTDVAADPRRSQDLRVAALAVVAGSLSTVDESQWTLLTAALAPELSVATRTAAADALTQAPLSPGQLDQLCSIIKAAGPLEINRLLTAYLRTTEEQLGLSLLASLREADALPSLRMDVLRQALAKYSPAVQQRVDALESLVNVDAAAQRQRIEELLPRIADGDVRRGHAVFHSAKAACTACHVVGHAGGTVGPELTRIGGIRTDRDLLESILFPSLSFVQSYESTLILTAEGRAISGRILDETDEHYVVATGPAEETRVRREEVEEMQPGTISVMPAGLDKQLSVQELADLVAFLKNAK
ncbi:MAG: HEAT repeat domain-containing protein [Pirellulales bacterium]|nr:HEAT repeat domain-containing protein [Pirellulales bacterium]